MATQRAVRVTRELSAQPIHPGSRLSPIALTLSVLGYDEDGEWVALALDMDLRGYGATFEEALGELSDLVMMQISFALFKSQPEILWKPAEPIWFERFAEARREKVHSIFRESPRDPHFDVAQLPLPPAHVLQSLKNDFILA